MGLYGEYSEAIRNGKQTIEVRLNDEKRREINISDTIKFIKVPVHDETLEVRVTELRNYDTFKKMYEDIPFRDFDCDGWTNEEMVEGTY